MRIRFKNIFKSKRLIVVTAAAVALVAVGWYYLRPDTTPTAPETKVITYSTDTPSETKPDDTYKWRGDPDDPKYIKLPTISTEGFIQNVGVDQNREVAVPNNIHIAGWFMDSMRPGQRGLSIIDGHVDGRADAGIFKNLANLKVNDGYTIEMGDGSLKHYKVKDVTTVSTKDAVNVLFSQDPKVISQLNLITCGGNFDRLARQYDKRVIVQSELVDE